MKKIPNAGNLSKCYSQEVGIFEISYVNRVYMNSQELIYKKLFDEEGCFWTTSMSTTSKIQAAKYVQKIIEIIERVSDDKKILLLTRNNLFYDKTTKQFGEIIGKICNRKIDVKTIHK